MSDTSTISETDEAALSWYFGPGLSIYQRSIFGAILDKLASDSAFSQDCKRCAGAGILGGPGGFAVTNACEACAGSGRAANGRTLCKPCGGMGTAGARRKAASCGGWCPDCGGTGSTALDERKRRRTPCGVCSEPYDATGRRRKRIFNPSCYNCLGTGEEPIAVRPMHKAPDAARDQADDVALVRFARTSRQVAKVHAVAPLLAEALAAFYGDDGQRCELAPNGLRCDALHPLTAQGRELQQAVEDLHTGSLRELRERAREAAVELYVLAARAWNIQARPQRDVLGLRRLAASLAELGYTELAANIRRANP